MYVYRAPYRVVPRFLFESTISFNSRTLLKTIFSSVSFFSIPDRTGTLLNEMFTMHGASCDRTVIIRIRTEARGDIRETNETRFVDSALVTIPFWLLYDR